NRTVPPSPPYASSRPSGLKATARISPTLRGHGSLESPVPVSQRLTFPALPPATTVRPSGLNVKHAPSFVCASPVSLSWTLRPVTASHRRIVPSLEPEARSLPSGLNATDHTGWVWSRRTRLGRIRSPGRQPARFQRRTVRSEPPEASVLPSGLTATASTRP